MSKRNLQNRIYKLLQENHLLSVSSILLLINKDNISYNKTSIYRSLDQMIEKEIIYQHNFNKSETLYELQSGHHAHMICKACGDILSTECDYNQPDKVGNFNIEYHHLTLIGTCESCIKN